MNRTKGSPLAEELLKSNLNTAISQDFEIFPEVSGRVLLTQENVRIDYLACPRPHLIDMGFIYKWFGIEVKHFRDFNNHDLGKKAKLMWQAINYAQSEFYVKGEVVRPDFIALYVGEHLKTRGEGSGARDWFALMHLGGYAKIFEFQIKGFSNWELRGSGGWVFTRVRGPRNRKISKKMRNWT